MISTACEDCMMVLNYTHKALGSLKVNPDLYGELLTSFLMNKFPHVLQPLMIWQFSEDYWWLDTIMKALAEEIHVNDKLLCYLHQSQGTDPLRWFRQVQHCLLVAEMDNPACNVTRHTTQMFANLLCNGKQGNISFRNQDADSTAYVNVTWLIIVAAVQNAPNVVTSTIYISICLKNNNTPQIEPTHPVWKTSPLGTAAHMMRTQAHQIRSVQTTDMNPSAQLHCLFPDCTS